MEPKCKPSPGNNFKIRESLLTELFENNKYIRTVRNTFIVFILSLFLNTVATDCLQNGQSQFGFRLIKYCFGKIHIAALFWAIFLFISFICYFIFTDWANIRFKLFPKSTSVKLLDSFGLLLLVGYYVFTFYVPMYIVRKYDLPPASATIVLTEQIRLAMKVHAFVRGNAPKILNYKCHSEDTVNMPNFLNFLYFLFAPTLIYQDEYPRTKVFRWKFAFYRLLEVIFQILLLSLVFEQYLLPPFRDFGVRKFTWGEIFIVTLKNTMLGLLLVIIGFYMILHSVQNFFAEVLRFGDREFYRDWWTSSDYSEYYRKWNIIVHRWLHAFIYRDVQEILTPNNKTVPVLMVFGVSGVVHEWICCNVTGAFFPAIMIEFLGVGATMYFVKIQKNDFFNMLFLYVVGFSASAFVSVYSLEYYARLNSPVQSLPRWLTCDCIQ